MCRRILLLHKVWCACVAVGCVRLYRQCNLKGSVRGGSTAIVFLKHLPGLYLSWRLPQTDRTSTRPPSTTHATTPPPSCIFLAGPCPQTCPINPKNGQHMDQHGPGMNGVQLRYAPHYSLTHRLKPQIPDPGQRTPKSQTSTRRTCCVRNATMLSISDPEPSMLDLLSEISLLASPWLDNQTRPIADALLEREIDVRSRISYIKQHKKRTTTHNNGTSNGLRHRMKGICPRIDVLVS